jgi:dihydroneopterin aldolase
MNARIHLKNMAFYGYHGHHPEENLRGQRFFVDLILSADLGAAAATDSLSATVDYSRVYELCRSIVEQQRVKLLETLCQRLLTAIFEGFPRVDRVEVVIRKPSAPIAGVLDYVAVEACADRPARHPRAGQ